ncbi:MAG: rhomboid family intramembrane serine protease [Nonlabens sp.]
MLNRITPMVKNLIILNVVCYICTAVVAPSLYEYFSLWFFKNPNFQIWQPITYMFLHSASDFSHIFFNMLWLLILGPEVEQWMGSQKFLFFYLACGVGSFIVVSGIDYLQYYSAVSDLVEQGYSREVIDNYYNQKLLISENVRDFWVPTVGASGAIFGIMAAYMYLFADRSMYLLFIPFPIKVKYLIGFYMGKELLATLGIIASTPGVAHLAHLGGAAFGFVMVWYWKKNDLNNYRYD